MLYRYEITVPEGQYNRHMGILTGADLVFNDSETVLYWTWIFEDRLRGPSCDMSNTVSYFTEAGNRKFRKAIRKLREAMREQGTDSICIKIDDPDPNKILYSDRYQVIMSRWDVELN